MLTFFCDGVFCSFHMITKIFKRFFSVLLILGCFSNTYAANSIPEFQCRGSSDHLKLFGYYGSGGYIWNLPSPPPEKADQALRSSNVIFIDFGSAEDELNQIKNAVSKGKKLIVGVDNLFAYIPRKTAKNKMIRYLPPEEAGGNRKQLYIRRLMPNHLENWNNFAQAIKPYQSSIVAFFTVDEPYKWRAWSGLSFKEEFRQWSDVNSIVKNTFPDIPIWINFGGSDGQEDPGYYMNKNFRIPDKTDWVSLDYYGSFESIPGRMRALKSHMKPEQKFLLIPDAWKQTMPTAYDELLRIKMAQSYYDLCHKDKQCIGLMPFVWFNSPGMRGLETMPQLANFYEKMHLCIDRGSSGEVIVPAKDDTKSNVSSESASNNAEKDKSKAQSGSGGGINATFANNPKLSMSKSLEAYLIARPSLSSAQQRKFDAYFLKIINDHPELKKVLTIKPKPGKNGKALVVPPEFKDLTDEEKAKSESESDEKSPLPKRQNGLSDLIKVNQEKAAPNLNNQMNDEPQEGSAQGTR
jgi:hypothetical protein